MAILQIGRWKKIKIEKRRSSAALQNVAATSRSDLRLRLGVRRCSAFLRGSYRETQSAVSAFVFAVERIFCTRSTTIAEVTCFMQA
jgi:hypothetical protein